MGIEGTYLNILKATYDKPTASIILNGQKPQAFPIRFGPRKRCPLLFNILLEILDIAIIAEKRYKGHPNWKERSETVIICR